MYLSKRERSKKAGKIKKATENVPYLRLYMPGKAGKEEVKKMDGNMVLPAIDMVGTGNNIKALRIANGFSVRDLQDIFGFSTPQAIYKWQNGATLPTVDNLVVLAALFHVHIDDILVTQDVAAARMAA